MCFYPRLSVRQALDGAAARLRALAAAYADRGDLANSAAHRAASDLIAGADTALLMDIVKDVPTARRALEDACSTDGPGVTMPELAIRRLVTDYLRQVLIDIDQ